MAVAVTSPRMMAQNTHFATESPESSAVRGMPAVYSRAFERVAGPMLPAGIGQLADVSARVLLHHVARES
jgi:hypothetical protein